MSNIEETNIEDLLGGSWRKRVKKKVTVEVNLTARDWELFTASMDCTKAAEALNIAATDALNTGDPITASRMFSEAQNKWAFYGAADSEPSAMFRDLLREVFGTVSFVH